MFVGRKQEIEIIEQAIQSSKAELGIVYGRRRVGKSTLLEYFTKTVPSFTFEGLEKGTTKVQIAHFVSQLAKQTNTLPVKAITWEDAFDTFTKYISKGRHYIIFDEFPWMANEQTKLIALLKFYWDRYWKKNPDITLILCGSIANFMVKHLVHSRALHNRKTFEMKIDPLPAFEAKQFFQNYRSTFEVSKFLMIFGGVPKYLEQLDPKKSLTLNLDRLCFQKNGFFVKEFETLFKEQFKVVRNYENIVEILAKGSLSKEKLAQIVQIDSGGGLKYYLDQLERADFIKSFQSFSFNKNSRSKTKKYVLWDEWLRFYFNYMQPNIQIIESNNRPGGFENFVSNSFDTYLGLAFERFCFKNIYSIFDALDISHFNVVNYGPFFKQGSRKSSSKSSGLQIDILIEQKGAILTLIECKFSVNPIGPTIIQEIEKKIHLLQAPKKYTIEKVLICANGVSSSLRKENYFHKILELDSILG